MTRQQILQEFENFSTKEQMKMISELFHVVEKRVGDDGNDKPNPNKELSIEERVEIVERLYGCAAMEGQKVPMTKEETREDYFNHLLEKYS